MNRRVLIALCVLFCLLPLTLRADTAPMQQAIVCNPIAQDRLNLRTEPSTRAESLGKFYNGTPVTVLRTEGDWAQVTLHDQLSGWMHMDYLAFGEDALNVVPAMPRVTIIVPEGKIVQDTMTDEASMRLSFPLGMQLDVMGITRQWLFVRSGESIVGFTRLSGITPQLDFSSTLAPPAASPTPFFTPEPLSASEQSASVRRTPTVVSVTRAP